MTIKVHYDKKFEKSTGIFVFEKLLPDNICDFFIDLHQNSNETYPGETSGGLSEWKTTTDLKTENPEAITVLKESTSIIREEVLGKYPILASRTTDITWPLIQKYDKGKGKYLPHFDSNVYGYEERYLAVLYYLNDVKKGGETRFHYQNVKIKPKKGNVIVFPATWKYSHEACVPISGDKYVISRFVYEWTKGKIR